MANICLTARFTNRAEMKSRS